MGNPKRAELNKAWVEFDKWKLGQIPHMTKPHERYDSKICHYCHKGWGKGRRRTRQHLLPKRRGGEFEPENLRWCCLLCNQLLSQVDDCPVIFNVYKTIILETPLKHLSLRIAFNVYIAMQHDRCNTVVNKLIDDLISMLKHKKKKYLAKKLLIYLKDVFPGTIRNRLPKEEIHTVFQS